MGWLCVFSCYFSQDLYEAVLVMAANENGTCKQKALTTCRCVFVRGTCHICAVWGFRVRFQLWQQENFIIVAEQKVFCRSGVSIAMQTKTYAPPLKAATLLRTQRTQNFKFPLQPHQKYYIQEIYNACRVYIAWCKHEREFGRTRKFV